MTDLQEGDCPLDEGLLHRLSGPVGGLRGAREYVVY
jgi:hypothetical protein